MRQLRVNMLLLCVTLAPLVFDVCANLITGGSLAKAFIGSNLWVLPILIISGATVLVFNIKEQLERRSANTPGKQTSFGHKIAAGVKSRKEISSSRPSAEEPGANETFKHSYAPDSDRIDALVADLWPATNSRARLEAAYRAAWVLASIMPRPDVLDEIRKVSLTHIQLNQPRLAWLRHPEADTSHADDPINVVTGRIGYLIREGGEQYHSGTSLPALDPYIAVGLIVVREHHSLYHSPCGVILHDGDQYRFERLLALSENPDPLLADSSGTSWADPNRGRRRGKVNYSDIGRVIRPDLAHTDSRLAREQAELVRHVMRHFFTDRLSSYIFDTLPEDTQVRLAARLLTAHQWMSPAAWRHWVKTGRDPVYAPTVEVASDVAYASSVVMVVGILVLACWQVAFWVSAGWSWYFGAARFLGMLPGWSKAVFLVLIVALVAMWAFESDVGGLAVLFALGILLVGGILSSPVVMLHSWVSSWLAAAIAVIGTLAAAPLLWWLGTLCEDKRWALRPVQLAAVDRRALGMSYSRSRFRPEHQVGHPDWCITSRAS